MDKYLLTHNDIEHLQGVEKTHFLNDKAQRLNKSLGDATGLTGFGFHIIEVEPGFYSTEFHKHYHEDECIYVLEGEATATIGDEQYHIGAGDFIGYRAGGLAHTIYNSGSDTFKCIVVGQRLSHDVGDYPNLQKRIYRQQGLPWNLVDIDDIAEPVAGNKA
ncbi:cupin domain-containing protein [Pseudoalteromonas byunsanensis]|uniref:Cupin n=1 Tax=Pseudoalteromonas byunsanensis TaxID=327939 RepID=A0A1S1N1R9_9GAMM|nr:cupin domain-containing protein [Pseudoalteromonas byunsanensis]OHU93608.1 cupin [Pseudoalteromonas byunsanensis]